MLNDDKSLDQLYAPQLKDSSRTTDPWSRFNPSKKRIIRPRDLPALLSISRTTIWRLERAGDFPKRIRLSAGAVGYDLQAVMDWCSSRQTMGVEP